MRCDKCYVLHSMSTMVINRSDEALESIGTFLRKIDIQMSLMIAFHRVAYD